ncbi:MAG: sulfotransferase [Candidatus Hadarchaeum sp.]
MTRSRDIIITGIPRSGTTLCCSLLNKLENLVALVEPWLGLRFWLSRDSGQACKHLEQFFKKTRRDILTRREARSLQIGGRLPTNPVEEQRDNNRLRKPIAKPGTIKITRKLSPDFWLVVKHPVPFTALLDELVHHFPTYGIIRNPLAVLASWNSVSLWVNKGRVPDAGRFAPNLKRALSCLTDRFERQVYLLNWFFEMYGRVLPEASVIRYEDVIASGGRALSVIVPEAAALNIPLESRNASPLYDASVICALGERLLKTNGAYWDFYSRESVERLIAEVIR